MTLKAEWHAIPDARAYRNKQDGETAAAVLIMCLLIACAVLLIW